MAASCRRVLVAGGAAGGIGILVGSRGRGGCEPNPMASLVAAPPLHHTRRPLRRAAHCTAAPGTDSAVFDRLNRRQRRRAADGWWLRAALHCCKRHRRPGRAVRGWCRRAESAPSSDSATCGAAGGLGITLSGGRPQPCVGFTLKPEYGDLRLEKVLDSSLSP